MGPPSLRNALVALLVCVAQAHAASGPIHSPRQPGHTIPKYVGQITPRNVGILLNDVAARRDRIIGLQVQIAPNGAGDPKGYVVDRDDRLFVISADVKTALADDGLEVVAPKDEASFLHGQWILDGFYVVKSGGIHQGVASFGLEKVDEGAVLLSPKYIVRRVSISRSGR